MKTLMISDETYAKLAAVKGKKSFTELLSELVDRAKLTRTDEIMAFAGIIDDEEAKILHKTVSDVRKNFRSRL